MGQSGLKKSFLFITLIQAGCLAPTAKVNEAHLGSEGTIVATTMKLELTNTIRAGNCEPLSLKFQNESGQSAQTQSATMITLESMVGNQPTGQFYLDSECLIATTMVSTSSLMTEVMIYFRSTLAANHAVRLSTSLWPSVQTTLSVLPSIHRVLEIVSTSTSIQAGTCSPSPARAESVDIYGNVAVFTGPFFTQIEGSLGVSFYSDAACTTPSTILSFNSNESISNDLYFKPVMAGPGLINASGYPTQGLSLSVSPGAATQISLAGPPVIAVGQCQAILLTPEDNLGNAAVLTSAVQVTITPLTHLFTDSACLTALSGSVTLSPTQNQATFYFKRNSPTPAPLSYTVNAGAFGVTQYDVSVQSNPPVLVQWDPNHTTTVTLTSGSCLLYKLKLKDGAGNPASYDNPNTFTLGTNIGNFYSDAACTTQIPNITFAPTDTQKTFYFKIPLNQDLFNGTMVANNFLLPVASQNFRPSRIVTTKMLDWIYTAISYTNILTIDEGYCTGHFNDSTGSQVIPPTTNMTFTINNTNGLPTPSECQSIIDSTLDNDNFGPTNTYIEGLYTGYNVSTIQATFNQQLPTFFDPPNSTVNYPHLRFSVVFDISHP